MLSVGLGNPQEGRLHGFRKHFELGPAALLLEHNQRLAEIRIAPRNLFPKNTYLRILATETQDGGPCNIRMVEVSGNQTAKILGVLAGSAAPALMHQELDAIHVPEHRRGRTRIGNPGRTPLDNFRPFALLVEPDQLGDLTPVNFGPCESQFLFKCLFQNFNITVLAENQRHDQPEIPGAYLPVGSVIPQERALRHCETSGAVQ